MIRMKRRGNRIEVGGCWVAGWPFYYCTMGVREVAKDKKKEGRKEGRKEKRKEKRKEAQL